MKKKKWPNERSSRKQYDCLQWYTFQSALRRIVKDYNLDTEKGAGEEQRQTMIVHIRAHRWKIKTALGGGQTLPSAY